MLRRELQFPIKKNKRNSLEPSEKIGMDKKKKGGAKRGRTEKRQEYEN